MGYLYAIKLCKNKYGIDLFVGYSNVHTPDCKFAIHKNYGGNCICSPSRGFVDSEQSESMVRNYGEAVYAWEERNGKISKQDKEDYALNLALTGLGVWVNGRKLKLY